MESIMQVSVIETVLIPTPSKETSSPNHSVEANFTTQQTSIEESKDYHEKITTSEFITPSVYSQLQDTQLASGSPSSFELCKICLVPLSQGQFKLSSCSHVFHEECVRMHILVAMEEAHFPLICAQEGCQCQIIISDLQMILSSSELDKFYHFSFKYYVSTSSERIFGCPTPGCDNYVFRGRWDFDRHFCCGGCLKEWCADCNLQWHTFMTCSEAKVESSYGKEDEEFEDMSNLKGFKRCPKCRTMLHLYTGCDYMECRCGYHFCFTCLKTHREHTHEEYLMAERRRKIDQQMKKLSKNPDSSQGIKVIDDHTRWIYAQRVKNELHLKEMQKIKAKPVPKYPPPPKGYLQSLKKIKEKKELLSKAESRHLLPARSTVKTNF